MRRCTIIRILIVIITATVPFFLMSQPLPPLPVYPVPSEAQLAWHQMEMNAFIHFTTNTFTDKEWGYGDESPLLFNPTAANPDQWMQVLKENGFKGIILTAKHHDGFCLWPSQYSNHTIAQSPYFKGKGDIVGEASSAAQRHNLKFGIYLSPWDRNSADYGTPEYITYYRNQLRELLTGYGPVFEMWFDGANGGKGYYGGKNEEVIVDKKNYYDWPTTLKIAHSIQPDILFFSDAGPDIRWLGNEKAIAGETNWNTINADTLYAGKEGIGEILTSGAEDGRQWIPAEADVSIRPGWFYHPNQDSLVKTPEQLFDIYLTSVGRGAVLLLNIPPDRRGLIADPDIESLRGFTQLLKQRLGKDLAQGAIVSASNYRGNHKKYAAQQLIDGKQDTYWCTDDDVIQSEIVIQLNEDKVLNFISLGEYIRLGQRIRAFEVDIKAKGNWVTVAHGTTIGYKRILALNGCITKEIRIRILDAKACPIIHTIEVF